MLYSWLIYISSSISVSLLVGKNIPFKFNIIIVLLYPILVIGLLISTFCCIYFCRLIKLILPLSILLTWLVNFPYISCWCHFPVAHNQITITLLYHYMKTRHTFLPPKYSFTVFTPDFRIHTLPLPVPQSTPQRRPLEHFPASHPPAMPRLAEILYF